MFADTGRLVGTGTNGPVAARLALLRAQRQLYQDAGVHIHIRNFAVRANRKRQPLVYSIDSQLSSPLIRSSTKWARSTSRPR